MCVCNVCFYSTWYTCHCEQMHKGWTVGMSHTVISICLDSNRRNQQLFSAHNPLSHKGNLPCFYTDSDTDSDSSCWTAHILVPGINKKYLVKQITHNDLVNFSFWLCIDPFFFWSKFFVKADHYSVNGCIIKAGKTIHPGNSSFGDKVTMHWLSPFRLFSTTVLIQKWWAQNAAI